MSSGLTATGSKPFLQCPFSMHREPTFSITPGRRYTFSYRPENDRHKLIDYLNPRFFEPLELKMHLGKSPREYRGGIGLSVKTEDIADSVSSPAKRDVAGQAASA